MGSYGREWEKIGEDGRKWEEMGENIVEKIIKEKGSKAFKQMVEMLYDESDEVREIAAEVLVRLAHNNPKIKEKLITKVKNVVKHSAKNDIAILYIVDILGEIGATEIVDELYKLIDLYDFEDAQILLYENIIKLGKGEEFYPVLRYYLLEGEERKQYGAQAAIAMSYYKNPEVVLDLLKAIESKDFDGEDLEIIKKALSNIIEMNPGYKELVDGKEWE